LQFAFYTGKQFPDSYYGGVFVAEHGSWNRSPRAGYQVAFVGFKDGKAAVDPAAVLDGFNPDPAGKSVIGRPVGVAVAPDGSLFGQRRRRRHYYRVSYKK
jgi:glucose/arabinose dehydrogenase